MRQRDVLRRMDRMAAVEIDMIVTKELTDTSACAPRRTIFPTAEAEQVAASASEWSLRWRTSRNLGLVQRSTRSALAATPSQRYFLPRALRFLFGFLVAAAFFFAGRFALAFAVAVLGAALGLVFAGALPARGIAAGCFGHRQSLLAAIATDRKFRGAAFSLAILPGCLPVLVAFSSGRFGHDMGDSGGCRSAECCVACGLQPRCL